MDKIKNLNYVKLVLNYFKFKILTAYIENI